MILTTKVRCSLQFPFEPRQQSGRHPKGPPCRVPPASALACLAACALALSAVPSRAAPDARIHELAQQEKAPLLDTLRDLVNIESGSKDAEGLARLAALIGERLTRLGGKVEIVEPTDIYRMDDTPEKPGAMVHAEFKGTGTKKIMLIAHMDTVYLRGMLKDQPFRIDGERAYGLGHRRRQAGRSPHPAHGSDAANPEVQGLRHADRADQRRRGDQLAGLAQHHHPHGGRTRRRVLLRRRRRGRPPAPGHQWHRRGVPDRGRQGLARRLRAGQGRERAGTSCPTRCCN